MTIKEMESKTQMSRANIRYYESEGLINPKRQENGYRVYSEDDADVLLKIKLLRSLDISLEEIKALQSGKDDLNAALTRHLQTLSDKRELLEWTQEVTEQMLSAGEHFDTLDASCYLRALESGGTQVLKKDVVQKLNLPWRRYWARCFDYALYSSVINGLIFRYSLNEFLSLLFPLLAMLLMEPLFLHLFTTTPGKAIFGIHVTDVEGGHLRYCDAIERTWVAMWEGEGLRIPLVSYYFLYKSYAKAEAGESLPWEADSELTINDNSRWRYGLFFGLNFIMIGLEIWLIQAMGG